jgi:hypothetical protein
LVLCFAAAAIASIVRPSWLWLLLLFPLCFIWVVPGAIWAVPLD